MNLVDLDALPVASATAAAWSALADGFRPPPKLTVSEWADRYRVLPTKGAAEPGPWRTSRVPFLREIQDALSPHDPVNEVVLCKSVQTAGTEAGLNFCGTVIHTQKAPMMAVQPTKDLAERWSKQRLAPMIEDCPELREKVRPARERDSGNTTRVKEWDGGVLMITGANSGPDLRSAPVRFLFCDEVDAWPIELDSGEGDPTEIVFARTTTFKRRKVFWVSTPTILSLSRIWPRWIESDQRRYFVPCPHCGEMQVLEWENLHWSPGDPFSAVYHCGGCGVGIDHSEKTKMLENGEWRATFPGRAVRGYHISGLYSPIGLGLTWGELAEKYEKAKNDPLKLKAFWNLRLGLCFEDPDEKLDEDEIRGRRESWVLRTIPRGCLLLTAGVDVQKDRFAIVVLGHGPDRETWTVDHVELPADTSRLDEWERVLTSYLETPIVNGFGFPMRIEATAIDSGYMTEVVMMYCRKHRGTVFATKGASTRLPSILGRPSRIDLKWNGQTIKKGGEIWLIGTDAGKSDLFGRLSSDRKRSPEDRRFHFAGDLEPAFFGQLCAEIYDPKKRKWVIVHKRNEALDCTVLATAATFHPAIRAHRWAVEWDRRRRNWEPDNGDLFSGPGGPVQVVALAAPEVPAPQAAGEARRGRRPRARFGGMR